jgi:low temperature requirement protein LtrA
VTSPGQSVERDSVSPLELFFDLVFVFAVSQLSHHLLGHLTWRGAAETAVILIGVFGVWSYTSWGSTLPGVRRLTHRWTILSVMVVGLIMNAGIGRAFEDQPWLFVVPFLLCRIGPALLWVATSTQLRDHYIAMLTWFSVTAIAWVGGALATAEHRLWWWVTAAVLELAGTWLAHPVPGRHHFRTREVSFAPGHMLERSRLFLLIALGEAILTTGSAVASTEPSASMVATAILSMIAIIALWALYFGGSDKLIAEQAATAADPLRTARLAVNTQILVLASLICLAVANELAIEDPTGDGSPALSLLMFGGPMLYVGVQSWYLWAATRRRSAAGPIAVIALAAAAGVSTMTAPLVAAAILCGTLLALLWITFSTRVVGQRS